MVQSPLEICSPGNLGKRNVKFGAHFIIKYTTLAKVNRVFLNFNMSKLGAVSFQYMGYSAQGGKNMRFMVQKAQHLLCHSD